MMLEIGFEDSSYVGGVELFELPKISSMTKAKSVKVQLK